MPAARTRFAVAHLSSLLAGGPRSTTRCPKGMIRRVATRCGGRSGTGTQPAARPRWRARGRRPHRAPRGRRRAPHANDRHHSQGVIPRALVLRREPKRLGTTCSELDAGLEVLGDDVEGALASNECAPVRIRMAPARSYLPPPLGLRGPDRWIRLDVDAPGPLVR